MVCSDSRPYRKICWRVSKGWALVGRKQQLNAASTAGDAVMLVHCTVLFEHCCLLLLLLLLLLLVSSLPAVAAAVGWCQTGYAFP